MATRIKYRRDTPGNWTAKNPVLAAGEPGYEISAGKSRFKVGDGVTAWTALPYYSDDVANTATYAPKWKANTAYGAGDAVLNPAGDIVTAKAAFTSGATYDATKWNLSSSFARSGPTNTVAILGDSIVQHNEIYQVPSAGPTTPGAGWIWWADLLERHRIKMVLNAGVSGETTAQINARVQTVINSGAKIVVEEGGTNDINGGATTAAIIANRTATQDALLAAGIRVVSAQVPPATSFSTAQKATAQAVNRWLATRAADGKISVARWWDALADPTTGAPKSGMTTDGTHMNTSGAARLGRVVAEAIKPYLNVADVVVTANDGTSGLTNGTCAGVLTSNAPSGWTANNGPSTPVYTSLKRPASDGGNEWWEINLASGNIRLEAISPAGTTWAAGDLVEVMCEFDTDSDFGPNITVMQVVAHARNAGGSVIAQGMGLSDSYSSTTRIPVERGVFAAYPVQTTALTTEVKIRLEMAGTGVFRIRNASVRKAA